jgi:hypothetical protein
MAKLHVTLQHVVDIVDSVQASGADHLMAGCTSMHDLIVVARPVAEPSYDVVAVRAPSSLRPVPAGMVVIEHLSVTGRNDQIVRPTGASVPLFWRFMIEKFGVHPTSDGSSSVGERRRAEWPVGGDNSAW